MLKRGLPALLQQVGETQAKTCVQQQACTGIRVVRELLEALLSLLRLAKLQTSLACPEKRLEPNVRRWPQRQGLVKKPCGRPILTVNEFAPALSEAGCGLDGAILSRVVGTLEMPQRLVCAVLRGKYKP